MTATASSSVVPPAVPERPMALEPKQWLAALAIMFVFFTPYQTLVQTVITDDAFRKGIEADPYDMTWVTVGYGVGVIYVEKTHRGHAGMLGGVRRPDPTGILDRRGRGAGPEGHALRRRLRYPRVGRADHHGADCDRDGD
jgi:hypothetical protein